ncbi:MAG: exosome protein [Nitrosarchaeum sp.]|nr:exosome protein [Nitrosarchaeum sp.]
MVEKLEITIDTIIHATEDIAIISSAFEEMFGLDEKEFIIHRTTGHFENPIITMNTKLLKKKAFVFIQKLMSQISKQQKEQMIDEIEERTENSRFHVRIGKQELIQGKISFRENDAVKIKIHVPVYNKKDTIKVFTELFEAFN